MAPPVGENETDETQQRDERRAGGRPASLRRTARPNASAAARSCPSGRPAAMGVRSVLYECSPTKAAAATGTNPRARTKSASSAAAFSKARLP